MSNEKLSEIKRALGLVSNGVGVGSFVYLRRIFEYLIEEAHQEAKECPDFQEEEYNRSRVIEKIEQLKDYLPPFLIKQKPIYGILSKGIHELTEAECLHSFNVLEKTIEMILNEKLAKKERIDSESEISKNINELNVKLRKTDSH